MKKNLFKILGITVLSLSFNYSNGQFIGVNTAEPKSTLHVVGNPAEVNQLDGIITPNITATQLKAKTYTEEQKGALIFVTETFADEADATGQVELVKSVGTYEFDGIKWNPFGGNSSDTLYDVVNRGNYSGKYISFTGDTTTKQGTRIGAIGMNPATNSYYFGNMNENQTGTHNLSMGFGAAKNLTTGSRNILFGFDAGAELDTETENTLIGWNVAKLMTSGSYNTMIGADIASSLPSGRNNVFIGDGSMLEANGISHFNSTLGMNTLRKRPTSWGNIAIGYQAGATTVGNHGVFIGNGAGQVTTSAAAESGLSGDSQLVIHSFVVQNDGSFINQDPTNPLIHGNFTQRWLRINGKFFVRPNYLSTADNDYSHLLFYNNTTGEVGKKDVSNIIVPAPPTTGNHVLKAVNGVMQWVAE
ncbi:MAG: hypothetical protein QM564_06460 [Bergeyella sp.]